jgi:hypothetical protein
VTDLISASLEVPAEFMKISAMFADEVGGHEQEDGDGK